MSINYTIDDMLKSVIDTQNELIQHLYILKQNTPNEMTLQEKRIYLNALFDKIEFIEQTRDEVELLKRKNFTLNDSTFCNINFELNIIDIKHEERVELSHNNEIPISLSYEEINKVNGYFKYYARPCTINGLKYYIVMNYLINHDSHFRNYIMKNILRLLLKLIIIFDIWILHAKKNLYNKLTLQIFALIKTIKLAISFKIILSIIMIQ